MSFDLDEYRRRAERFSEELSREYYLHLAGHKAELEIEPIYDRHEDLFGRAQVERLGELAGRASGGDEGRRLRYLLQFAFDGLLGLETRSESAELAGLEASLEVDPGDGPVPYRAVPIEQANEPGSDRRAALEEARNAVLDRRLNPLHRAMLERAHELCRALGWPSYAAAYAELRGIDLPALAGQTAAFLEATEDAYAAIVDPQLRRTGMPQLGELRRSDLPRFFRAVDLDSNFPADRLIASFADTLAGLGIGLGRQTNVHLDAESRRTKSPRAFCSTPRVPDEIYLVIAPTGGRDDYGTLFHEGGHAEHFANTDPGLAFEFRHLGDNSVTESFAFLVEHLVEDRDWLRHRLGLEDPEPAEAHARAFRLVLVRRYAAKLAYELELHGESASIGEMPGRYEEALTKALRIPWPRASWLADVDGGFYAACYLRAWALETRWRAALRERFGPSWFSSPDAGEWLRSLWSHGQRLDAAELLAETLGGELDFTVMAAELVSPAG
ncbi:MAG: hypothetical protein AUG48_07890 [Actinobacteria bacterium 13_1_20CM_3_68_9]|nr:MAG: hypothetical protein AUG48_07890 [Actinobacteria bacterium 13_1_20CM_3_68_9]